MVRRVHRWHNKSMVRIAMYGVNAQDKAFFQHVFKDLKADVTYFKGPLDAATLDPNTTVLSIFVDSPVTRQVIDALPGLKLIACRSTGTNHIDAEAAKQRGITLANVAAYGGTTVAEYAFTLLLMLTRRIPQVLYESSSSQPNRERERGTDLFGKTMGIIGTGNIGLGAARIACGFGMKVLGYDAKPRPDEAKTIGFEYTNINDLLARSDIISLHLPYTPQTHHFLSRQNLGKLRHGAIVVNTARGELIDTAALVDALHGGHIHSAALDVLESEYLMDPDQLINLASHNDAAKQTLRHATAIAALQRMPNVIVTNHNAFNTVEAIERINRVTAENILNFLKV